MKNYAQAVTAGALAMALATTAQAETTFYGSLRLGIDYVDASTEDDGANGRDYLSRVGAKAKIDLDGGLQGLAQVEYGIRDDDFVNFRQNGQPTLRLAQVGLKGDFGTIWYGSQTMIWHKMVRGAYFSDGNDTIRLATIREDDLLQYYYTNGGLTIGAGLQTENQDGDDVDTYQAGIQYKTGPVKLQAAYLKDNQGDNTGDLIGLRAWYNITKSLTVSAYYHAQDEDFDWKGGSTGNVRLRGASVNGNVNGVDNCSGEERTNSGVYAKYKFGANQIHTRYAVDACEDKGDISSVKVEYVRFLGKKYRTWVSYETLDSDDDRKPSTGEDMSEVQLGLRMDF